MRENHKSDKHNTISDIMCQNSDKSDILLGDKSDILVQAWQKW